MQTLKTYSKHDFITSKKILFSFLLSDTKKYLSCHPKSIPLVRSKDIDKLFKNPISYRAFKQINKEFHNLKSSGRFPIQNSWYSSKFSEQIQNFSTTSGWQQNKDDDRSSPGNPDKKPNNDEDAQLFLRKLFLTGLFAYFTIVCLRYIFHTENVKETAEPVSWNEFVHHMLAKGEVEQIIVYPEFGNAVIKLYNGAIVKGHRVDHQVYYMTLADVNSFEEKLRNVERSLGIKSGEAVTVIYDRKLEIVKHISRVLLVMLIFAPLIFLARKKMGVSVDFFSQIKAAKFTLVDPVTGAGKGVRFEDVAGLKEAKIEVMEFVDYLKRPEHYKTLGAKVPKGALLLGPPGCGKTLLAKAVATEASVPFLSMNGSEFIEMYGGLGAARVRDLFKEGKKRAPSIIYIDEIDALGKKRASGNSSMAYDSSESEQTLNQLLVEMDGMITKEGVIILASTNRAEVLDKALLRPGRFDRHILIDLPTLEERKQIFEQHLKRIALEYKPSAYSERLAYLTPGFSGADIANVCNEAALHAARFKKKIVDASDLAYGVDRMVGGTEKRDHAMSLSEKRVVAYHESGHALVGWLLEHTDALLKVTIVPRTNLALGFAQYTPTDQKLYTKEELFERMCMMLGGRVAESLTFNKITTGAQNDLTKVTKIAYAQVQQYGMCPTLGLLSFDEEQTTTKTKKIYSKKLANLMDMEARRLIAQAYQRTEKLLSENRKKLELIAETLFKKETLMYDDVVSLIGPPAYKKKRLIEPAEFERSIKSIEESAASSTDTPTTSSV